MEYTSSAYTPWLPPTSIDKLEKVQNAAMRAIAGLAATCPIQFLRLETNLEPLQLRLEKSDVILWDRYRRLPDEDQRKKMILNLNSHKIFLVFSKKKINRVICEMKITMMMYTMTS